MAANHDIFAARRLHGVSRKRVARLGIVGGIGKSCFRVFDELKIIPAPAFEIDSPFPQVHRLGTREKTGSVRLAFLICMAGQPSARMNIEPMLFCLILGCLVTLLTLPLLLLSGWKGSLQNEIQRRNTGAQPTESSRPAVSKWGALPLAASFVAVSILASMAFPDSAADSRQNWTILITGLAIFAIGLLDDFTPLGARRRLVLQSLVAAVACFQGVQLEAINTPLAALGIHLEHWSGLATLGWLVLVIALFQRINSVNWLAGCLGLLAMGLLARGSTGNSFAGLCAVGMAGALVGFLVYNLPPTRVRLGSSGAGLLGYLVGILSVSNSHQDHESSVLAMMLIAVLGASFATWRNAIKLLPSYPLRPKPATRPSISRITSPRPHERR